MKCAQAESSIYLYTELDRSEREKIDKHIAACITCKALFERLKEERLVVKQIFRGDLPEHDLVSITSKVMTSIESLQNKNRSAWYVLSDTLRAGAVRYTMAAMSVLLMVAFVLQQHEWNAPAVQDVYHNRNIAAKTALNSASLHKALKDSKEKSENVKISVYACVVRCIKIRNANCADCTSAISKLKLP